MYEGDPFSSSQDYALGCMLWDEGCLYQHSRRQISALVKAGLVIISLLLVYMLLEQRCIFRVHFYVFYGKFNTYDEKLASVSFWPLLIIELVAREVPACLIIR